MNLDDETLLTAFLDNELDPADRSAVSWAIESSPAHAGRLRELSKTHELVAGLGRPTIPVDLAPNLIFHLATPRRPLRVRVASQIAALTLAGGGIAMAASLLGAVFFVYRATHNLNEPEPIVVAEVATIARQKTTTNPAPMLAQEKPPLLERLVSASRAQPEIASANAPAPAALPLQPGAIVREKADRERIAGMLIRPDVHRILIVTDVIDAGDRIKTMIERDVRKFPEFGRITVSEGIVIDPRHPAEADVFTLVLDGREAEPFLGKLTRAFPKTGVVIEPRTDPQLLTQLAEVGHATILPGLSPASAALPLVVALDDRSMGRRARSDSKVGSFVMPDMDAMVGSEADNKADTNMGLNVDGDLPRGAPARFPTSSDPATYLVWVTRPTARR